MRNQALKNCLIFSILMLALPVYSSAERSQESICLADYSIAQKQLPHNLSQEQLAKLQEIADQGLADEGWKYLAELGDKYGDVSYKVVTSDPEFRNEKFHKMVRRHWKSTVGKEKLEEFFISLAVVHFRQYVEILHTGFWPDSDQILLSYLSASRQSGLPDKVVFDATWVKSGMNKIIGWEKIVGLQKERIVRPSAVCTDIDGTAGFFKLLLNLIKLPF